MSISVVCPSAPQVCVKPLCFSLPYHQEGTPVASLSILTPQKYGSIPSKPSGHEHVEEEPAAEICPGNLSKAKAQNVIDISCCEESCWNVEDPKDGGDPL